MILFILYASASFPGTRSLSLVFLHYTTAHAMFYVDFQGGPIPASRGRNSVSLKLGLTSSPIMTVDDPCMSIGHNAWSRQKA